MEHTQPNRAWHSRNEVTAREGIDTPPFFSFRFQSAKCRNEVTAREGIDTRYY